MFCKCFNASHPFAWRWKALCDECQEWAAAPSWDEAADIAWGLWSLFDPAHQSKAAQWAAQNITRAKYRKHQERYERWGCFRSENHPHCSDGSDG